jgi:hypothetical protein
MDPEGFTVNDAARIVGVFAIRHSSQLTLMPGRLAAEDQAAENEPPTSASETA